MFINISRVKKGEKIFNFEKKWEDFNIEFDLINEFIDPVLINIEANFNKQELQLNINIKSQLIMQCARCLENFDYNVNLQFIKVFKLKELDEYYTKQNKNEDFEIIKPTTETVNIYNDIRDYIILSFPMKPLCKEDCKGLCARCGKNLNYEKCICKKEIDPRLLVFKQLLIGQGGK